MKKNLGFSLLEALIAMSLLGFGLLAFDAMQMMALKQITEAAKRA